MVNNRKLETATQLLNKLLVTGSIEKKDGNRELYEAYYDTDVKNILDIMTETMGLITFVQGNRIYMYASANSDYLPSNAERVSKIKGAGKVSRLYLADIIFLTFLSEIFSGKNAMQLKRDYISIDDLIVAIKNRFDSIDADDENIDFDTKLNFRTAKAEWDALIIEAGFDEQKLTSKTRYGFIINTMTYYQNNDLVFKGSDNPILFYPTLKLKDFIAAGQFDIDRFNKILTSLEELPNA